jgi:hypothetical protein
MKTDSLIVPQSTLMDILTMIEEGDSGNAHDLLKAAIDLCPPCNRVEAEAAPSLLHACGRALLYLYKAQADGMNTVVPVQNAIGIVEAAIAQARLTEC